MGESHIPLSWAVPQVPGPLFQPLLNGVRGSLLLCTLVQKGEICFSLLPLKETKKEDMLTETLSFKFSLLPFSSSNDC